MKNATLVRNRNITEFRALGLDHGKIDKDKGVIHGVSLITANVEARGHDLHTDNTTLEQICALATEMGQVPVKWNHKSGADAVNGFVTNFRVDGNKAKADWHLLLEHNDYKKAIELAERMPQNVGLSVAFVGAAPEQKNGKKFARVEELVSVDLVAQPAANPGGLFEAVDSLNWGKPMNTATNPNAAAGTQETEPTLAEIKELITGQAQTIATLKQQLDGVVAQMREDQPLSLEELNQIALLDDAELAKMNLTREEVDKAVADAMAGVDDDEQHDYGDGPVRGGVVRAPGRDFVAGEGAQPGVVRQPNPALAPVMAELSDLRNTVNFMVRQQKLEKQSEEAEALQTFFDSIEAKVTTLQEENTKLLARNEALQKAFEAGGGAVTPSGEFKMPAGALKDGSRPAGATTEFDELVAAKVVEFADKHPEFSRARVRRMAIEFVQKENNGAYMKHLEAKGVAIELGQ